MFEWTQEWVSLLERSSGVNCSDPGNAVEIAAAIRDLNRIFTGPPGTASSPYGRDRRFRRAYSLYYVMANLPKIIHIMETHGIDPASIRSLIDLGTGPGTIPLAFLALLHRSDRAAREVDIMCMDRSREFLDLAGYLIRNWRGELKVEGKTRLVIGDVLDSKRLQPGSADLLTIGNMMTEIPDAAIHRRIVRIAETVVADGKWMLMLEPASRSAARKVLAVRDELIRTGWHVEGPCPGDYPCPARQREEDWCHHRLLWNRPDVVRTLDRAAGFDKQFLNFSYCLLRKTAKEGVVQEAPRSCFVVVSDLLASKGKYEVYLCGRGRKVLVKIDKKHVSDPNRDILRVQRYDRVSLDVDEGMDARMELTSSSRFFLVNRNMEGQ